MKPRALSAPDGTDVVAEQAVLGGLLLDGRDAWCKVREDFSPDLFADPLARSVAEVLAERAKRDADLDPVQVVGELLALGHVDAADLVPQLVRALGTSGNLAAYVEQLKEARGRRVAGAAARSLFRFVTADRVRTEPVEWLWKGYVPRGAISVLDGDPKTGKTTLALSLAAGITSGREPPTSASAVRDPEAVVVLSYEDDLARTLRPRLEKAGADLGRVALLDSREPAAPMLRIPSGVPGLEAKVRELRAALVIVDPLTAALDGEVDANKDASVRAALAPLAAMAQRTKTAVLLVRHLNKRSEGSALYRGGGSIGITGAARAVLLAAKDPDVPGLCVLATVACNLAPPSDSPSLAYRIGNADGWARIEWVGASEHTADSLLTARPGPDPVKLPQAIAFLRDALATGPVMVRGLSERAEEAGLAWRTVERAKRNLGVEAVKDGGRSWWRLPGSAREGT